jgi:hypothetical protein
VVGSVRETSRVNDWFFWMVWKYVERGSDIFGWLVFFLLRATFLLVTTFSLLYLKAAVMLESLRR